MRYRLTRVLALAAVHFLAIHDGVSQSPSTERPNIVLILADDMGWGDLTCYNSESKIPTPNIDRIANAGVRFTDAHTPSSVCTPTRYSLLSGRYSWRTRLKSSVLDGFSPPLIENDRPTLASFLKARGYATGCIGKWHLGMQWTRTDGKPENVDRADKFRPGDNIDFTRPVTAGPLTVGFDSYFGISASLDMPPYCWIENDRCDPAPDTSVPTAKNTIFLNQQGGRAASDFAVDGVLPVLKRRAIEWLQNQTEARDKQPFFLYLPLTSPHLPVAPSSAFKGRSKVGLYGDFMLETDDLVGGVLDALEKRNTAENTLVLFTSDNGGLWHQWTPREKDDLARYRPTPRAQYTMQFGHQSNAHLRGTKADIWEGGHRVPFLVRWPGRTPGGMVSNEPIELTDIFATVAEILGEAIPKGGAPDSFSFLSAMKMKARKSPVRPFLIHHSLRGLFAIRQGEWKYVEARGSGGFSQPRQIQLKPGEPTGHLYNLADDPGETMNLALREKAVANRLSALLQSAKSGQRLREN